MPLSREQFFLQRRRISDVLEYMDRHLNDPQIALDTLAEVACLSRFHFERLYAERVGETPMASLRRLRLQQAHQRLREGDVWSITDLSVQYGYGSVAAFSRAFVRAFCHAPSRVVVLGRPNLDPVLEIVRVPDVPVVWTPYSGTAVEVFGAGHEVEWIVANAGGRNWRHWALHPEGWVDPAVQPETRVRMWHCIPVLGLPPDLVGLERGCLPGGDYARFAVLGPGPIDVVRLRARVPVETSWQLTDGPMLRHFPKSLHFTPVAEREQHLYLSVAR